ncbi:MAG TPA: HEAT repeat domain-containing protein [Gemmatimonadales bacterium]|jgi:hypothetical protein
MRDADRLILLLGRLIDLVRRSPDPDEDHKATLRSLVDAARARSVTVRQDGGILKVEGIVVGSDTPFSGLVSAQMQAHGLSEMRIAHGASAMDFLGLIRTIAHDPAGYPGHLEVSDRLLQSGATGVSVMTVQAEQAAVHERGLRVTEALQAIGGSEVDMPRPPAPPARRDLGLVTQSSGAAYDDTLRVLLSAAHTLSEAISQLHADAEPELLRRQLDTVQGTVVKALDAGRVDQAVDGVAALVRKELEAKTDDGRRAFTVALRRLLVDQHLDKFAGYLLDELYATDVQTILRRAGKPGTKILIDRLVQAQTYAERKAYLNVLRDVEEGTEAVAGMLSHGQWYVVRNMADLAGELRIQEAVPALGRAIGHDDARVRRSVGVALAKIGTPPTVPHLRKVLDDPDTSVRVAVFSEVGGRGHSSLAMPLFTAAEKEESGDVRAEYYRALGRIATPDAVDALRQAAEPGGRVLGRRPVGDRIAAVEGLALAATDQARSALEGLLNDRVKEVRDAAHLAMRRANV